MKAKPSTPAKRELIDRLGALVVRWQDETQKYDELVGEAFRLNAAERHCLSLLWSGPQTASAIARAVRLTPAAVTALIDRLEGRGLVAREADPGDRRKVLVRATEAAAAITRSAYTPLAEAGAELLSRYTESELQTLVRFAREAIALQERFTEGLEAKQAGGGGRA